MRQTRTHQGCLCVGLSVLFMVGVGSIVSAQGFQRMALAAGSYRVGAGGSARIAAYCLDFARDAPTPSTLYSRLLVGEQSASVVIGNRRMSLQAAINAGEIEIRGTGLTIERLRSVRPRTPGERRQLTRLLDAYDALPLDQQAALDLRFAQYAAENGLADHTGLDIRSKTSEDVRIDISAATVVGGQHDSIDGLPLAQLKAGAVEEPQHLAQDRLWMAAHQTRLQQLGLFPGEVTGLADAGTTKAVRRFQAAEGLESNGKLDHATSAALDAAVTRAGRLASLNTDATIQVFALETQSSRPNAALYALYSSGGLVYRGDRFADAVSALMQRSAAAANVAQYIDVTALTPADRDSLKSSAQIASATDALPNLRFLEVSGETAEAMFTPNARLLQVTVPQVDGVGVSARIRFSVPDKPEMVISVWARTRALLMAFLDRLGDMFYRLDRTDSVASAVRHARRRLVELHNIPIETLNRDLRIEFGLTQLSEWRSTDPVRVH